MRSYGPASAKPAVSAPSSAPAEVIVSEPKKKKKRRRKSALALAAPPLLIIALSVVLALYFISFYAIKGSAMGSTLRAGDVVLSVRPDFIRLSQGDIISYNLEDKSMVKRVVATSAQTVDIKEDGTVTVDGKAIDESYLGDNSLDKGQCDIVFPYVVPAGRVFVMGDNREQSIDSRAVSAGCVSGGQVTGKVVFRLWPISGIGTVA